MIIELILIIIMNYLLTYTVVNVLFIGDPFEGEEDNGFVAIIVGVMEPENLKTEVSVNLTTEDIVGISNAATGKCKHGDNCLSQYPFHFSFHSWC